MKKLMAFLVTVTMATAAFAQCQPGGQRGNGPERVVVYNGNGYGNNGYGNNGYGNNGYGPNSYSFSARERDIQVAQINRDYDSRVREINNRLFMSRNKKDRLIYALEEQRTIELRRVYARFGDRNNRDCNNGRRNRY